MEAQKAQARRAVLAHFERPTRKRTRPFTPRRVFPNFLIHASALQLATAPTLFPLHPYARLTNTCHMPCHPLGQRHVLRHQGLQHVKALVAWGRKRREYGGQGLGQGREGGTSVY